MPSLRQIAPPRLRNLADRLGWVEGQPNGLVKPGEALYFWMARFIGSSTVLTSDQVDLILTTFGKAIRQYGEKFADEFDAKKPELTIGHLMIADNRFASVSGAELFLDLTSGDTVKSLSRAPVLVLNYNMGEVYMRSIASLNRQQDEAGQESNHARRSAYSPRGSQPLLG